MKTKLLACILLLSGLLGVAPAWAMLSVSKCAISSGGTANPATVAFGSSVPSGDAIEVLVIGTTNGGTMTVSDSINGTYSSANSSTYSGGLAFSWVKASASGTPTVSVANPNGNNIRVSACDITGFTGTPTLDSSVSAAFHAASSTTAVSASPVTSGRNTEMLIFGLSTGAQGTSWSSAPGGWTIQNGTNDTATTEQLTAYEATSGTTNNLSGTLSTTSSWYSIAIGIYDAGGVSPQKASQFFLGI